jgi:hypothetical protein
MPAILLIDYLLEGRQTYGAQVARASIAFMFEHSIEKAAQPFAWLFERVAAGLSRVPGLRGLSARLVKRARTLRATAGMARCAYEIRLLELRMLKTIADGNAALSAFDSRLAALSKPCTDPQAKFGEQAIANQPTDLDRLRSLDRAYELGLIAFKDYSDQRAALECEALAKIAGLQILVSIAGRFAMGLVEAAGASVEESRTEGPPRRRSRRRNSRWPRRAKPRPGRVTRRGPSGRNIDD